MVDADGRTQRMDGLRLDGYTISPPCEPNGLNLGLRELKTYVVGAH